MLTTPVNHKSKKCQPFEFNFMKVVQLWSLKVSLLKEVAACPSDLIKLYFKFLSQLYVVWWNERVPTQNKWSSALTKIIRITSSISFHSFIFFSGMNVYYMNMKKIIYVYSMCMCGFAYVHECVRIYTSSYTWSHTQVINDERKAEGTHLEKMRTG
jgi:hypothetical protein